MSRHEPRRDIAFRRPDPAADAPISDLLPGSPAFEYTSDAPIMVAALDERVKRACAMLRADHLYSQHFDATNEIYFDLADAQAAPSGEALPVISDELRKKFSS